MPIHHNDDVVAAPVATETKTATPEPVAQTQPVVEQPSFNQPQPTTYISPNAQQGVPMSVPNQTIQTNGLDALHNMLFNVLGGDGVNERITQLADIGKEYYESTKKSNTGSHMQVDFIIAPGRRISDYYGGVIVAVPYRAPNTNKVQIGYHLVIVESSTRLKPQIVPIDGQNATLPMTPGNSVNVNTDAGVQQLLRERFGNDVELIEAGYSVLPHEADISNLAFTHNMLTHAANACYTRIQVLNRDSVLDEGVMLANLISANNGVGVSAQIEDHPPAQTDIFGNPIRADWIIRALATQKANNQNGQEQGMAELGSVAAFCSPVYAAPSQQVSQFGQVQQGTRHYYNKVTIREFRQGNIRLSLGTLFLLIASTGLLATNGLWKRKYIPNNHIPSGVMDVNDIGALGYEVPQLNPDGKPGMVDTKSAAFNNEAFTRYMDMLFHPDSMFAIDVPDGHYLLNILLNEAKGGHESRNIILNVLNSMTGNRFSQHFDANTMRMFQNHDIRIINGYYKSSSAGTNVSLDVLDHLAMLNVVKGDSIAVRDYEACYLFGSADVRLAKRLEIINNLSDNTAVVKSYSSQIYITPQMLTALMNSFKEAGIFPEIHGVGYNNMNAHTRPTVDMFSGLTVNPNAINNMFANNSGYNANNGFYHKHGFGGYFG